MTDRAIGRRHILAGAGVVALAAPAVARAQNEPIRIGEINSYTALPAFTSPTARAGNWRRNRSTPRAASAGRMLEVISRDDAGKPDDAVRVANELVETRRSICWPAASSPISGSRSAISRNQNKRLFVAAEPLTDALVWEQRQPLHLPPARHRTYMQAAMLVEEAAKLPAKRWATVAPNYEYGQSAVRCSRNC